jgi:hypothetical protein
MTVWTRVCVGERVPYRTREEELRAGSGLTSVEGIQEP